MPISRYPRTGQRLAPIKLSEVLDTPLPTRLQSSRYSKLRDLDESVWTHFAQSTCIELAKMIVNTVAKRLHTLPASIRNGDLPQFSGGLVLGDLSIEPRTFNVLLRALGSANATLDKLRDFKAADLLKMYSFGAKSFVDLLVALESLPGGDSALHASAEDQSNSLSCLRLRKQCARIYRMSIDIQTADPRLARLLLPLAAQIRAVSKCSQQHKTLKALVEAINSCQPDTASARELATLLRKIRGEIYRLRKMKLEQELKEIIESVSHGKNTTIVLSYLGWDGTGTHTLQEIGDRNGLTRERIRQICDRPIRALQGKTVFAPATIRALSLIDSAVPCEAQRLEQLLATKRISLRPFGLEGLLTAAEILSKQADFGFDLSYSRVVVPRSGQHLVGIVQRIARRAIERWGAATIDGITTEVDAETNAVLGPSFVADVVQLRTDFSWLDIDSGWFWLSSVPRNRILTQINKILAAAKRVSINELRPGVSRNYRLEGFAPPRRVLLEICRQQPGFNVDGDIISADIPESEWLSAVEVTMASVLRRNGVVMLREAFERNCIAAGINRSTFYMYLANCPIFERFAPGIYGLRGAEVTPSDIETLSRQVRHNSRVLKGSGWTQDGKLQLYFDVSNAMLTTGVFSIPSSLQRFLVGEFSLEGLNGYPFGQIASRDGRGWGLQPVFRRIGGEVGDRLAITYDLKARRAVFSIGESDENEF